MLRESAQLAATVGTHVAVTDVIGEDKDAFALELFELAGAESERLAIDVCVVLTQQRRGGNFNWRILQTHRASQFIRPFEEKQH